MRVDLITLASGSECITAMEMLWIKDFSVEGVARSAGTESLTGLSSFGVGVAGLNHKLVDYTVEEHAVVVAFVDQLDEVIAMDGSVVE